MGDLIIGIAASTDTGGWILIRQGCGLKPLQIDIPYRGSVKSVRTSRYSSDCGICHWERKYDKDIWNAIKEVGLPYMIRETGFSRTKILRAISIKGNPVLKTLWPIWMALKKAGYVLTVGVHGCGVAPRGK